MSIASTKPPVQPGSTHVQAVSLRGWMLRDRPLLSLAVSLGVVLLAALVYQASQHLLGTALAMVAMLIVLRRVWLPIRYRLDAQGIIRQVWGRSRRIPWSAVSRYEACRHGVVLIPHGADYRLAAGQGLFIPWCGRREEVMSLVVQFVLPAAVVEGRG